MSMPPMTPPSDGDVNRGPALLAIFWAEVGIATTFVAMRFYTRGTLRSIGADDWTILATLVMYIVTLALCTVLVSYGLGRHVFYLSPDDQLQMAKWNWIVQPFGILTLPLGKISVVLLLQRIMAPGADWRKWFLWINMALFTVVMIVAAIISFAQCNPPRALWTAVPGAVCWNPAIQADWAVFGSSYSAFLDFVLALFPIWIVWGLRLSTPKKVALCFLLGMGILSGICAAIKTSQSLDLGLREDISWGLFSLYAWSSSEIFLNIVCACVPTLKPLYDFFAKGTPMTTSKKSSYTGASSQELKSKKLGGGSSWAGSSTTPTTTSLGSNMARSQVDESVINYHQSITVESQRAGQPLAPHEMF